jgi:uncharacterized membrane protein
MPVREWLCRRWWLVALLLGLTVLPRLAWVAQMQWDGYDLAIYHNLCWNLSEGRGFWSDVLGRSHLGEHASPLIALFAPLYVLVADLRWLPAMQGVAVAAVALAAWWIAEQRLAALSDPRRRCWGLALFAALLLGYVPLWSAWWHDPQPVVYGAAALAWALVAIERRRWWACGVLVALLLASRESAALAGLGLAWYAWRRHAAPRAAVVLLLASLLWAAFAMLILMPGAREGLAWEHTSRLAPSAEPGAKLVYCARLLGQLGGLPLLDPVTALAALPGILLNLATGHLPQLSSAYHYDAQIAPFLLAAAAAGLARVLAWEVRWPWLVPPFAAALAWGGLPPVRRIIQLAESGQRRAAAMTQDELGTLRLPPGPLAADPQLAPLLCLRQGFRSLRSGTDRGEVRRIAALPPGTLLVVQRWWWLRLAPAPALTRPPRHYGPVLEVRERSSAP